MRNAFLAVCIFVLSGYTGIAQTWDKEETDIFVESCVAEAKNYFTKQGALEYCTCTMDKIMELYPDAAYIEFMSDEELSIITELCIIEIMKEEKDIFLAWGDETKTAFLEGCEEELAGTGIDSKLYCPCALEEVLKLYETPFQAAGMTEEVIYQIAGKCLGE